MQLTKGDWILVITICAIAVLVGALLPHKMPWGW